MTSEFPKFLELPAELRLMIWQCVMDDIPKQRVVTVSTPAQPILPAIDGLHNLLHACKESRDLFLLRYTSAFGLSRYGCEYAGGLTYRRLIELDSRKEFPPRYAAWNGVQDIVTIWSKAGWGCTSVLTVETFNNILMNNSLVKAGEYCPPVAYPSDIMFYRDRHLSRKSTWNPLPIFGRPYPLLGPALWFDANNDILLFRYDRITLGWTGGPSPANPMMDEFLDIKAKKIAFEISGGCLDFGTKPTSLFSTKAHFWNTTEYGFRLPNFPMAENVSFLIPDWYEVVTITLDEKNWLNGRQWCFSLDTDSSMFKEEMGKRWDSVTWRVTIAKVEGWSFNELLRTWAPHLFLWRLGKEWLYDRRTANGPRRWNFRKKAASDANSGWEAVFVEGLEGETILGPSRYQEDAMWYVKQQDVDAMFRQPRRSVFRKELRC